MSSNKQIYGLLAGIAGGVVTKSVYGRKDNTSTEDQVIHQSLNGHVRYPKIVPFKGSGNWPTSCIDLHSCKQK